MDVGNKTETESKTKSAVRIATKHGECPVCGGESSLIFQKTGIDGRNAIILNDWFERRLAPDTVVIIGGNPIDELNYLIRCHRICSRCLFVTSIQEENELKAVLTLNAIRSLKSARGRRLALLKNILQKRISNPNEWMSAFEQRLKARRIDPDVFTPEGRKKFINPVFRTPLIKLCHEFLTNHEQGDAFQNISSKVFAHGLQSLMDIILTPPLDRGFIEAVHLLEGFCLLNIIAANNDFVFTSNNIPLNLDDIHKFKKAFKKSRDGLVTRFHLLFAALSNILTLSELTDDNTLRSHYLEMALIFAELSLQHEDRTYETPEEKERKKKTASAHDAPPRSSQTIAVPVEKIASNQIESPGDDIEIDPRRVSHNYEILSYIILKLH